MPVDRARNHVEPARVELARARRDAAADRGDPLARDRDVRVERAARAHDAAAPDDEVIAHRGRILVGVTDWPASSAPRSRGLSAYDPGESAEELRRRYGVAEIVRLNRNEDLFEPFPGALEAAAAELANVSRYPEETHREFAAAVAAAGRARRPIGSSPATGSRALIVTLSDGCSLDPGDAVVVARAELRPLRAGRAPGAAPSVHVRRAARAAPRPRGDGGARARDRGAPRLGLRPQQPDRLADRARTSGARSSTRSPSAARSRSTRPTATTSTRTGGSSAVRDVHEGRPIVILRTFSKLFGLAGLRLGYAIADPSMAAILGAVHEPFNVNRPALAAGLECLRHPEIIDARRAHASPPRERCSPSASWRPASRRCPRRPTSCSR